MEKEKYYVCYSGSVYLYTEIEAENEDEAYDISKTMPAEPTRDMKLVILSADLNLELDCEYIPKVAECKHSAVNETLKSSLIEAAYTQGETRAAIQKEAKVAQLTKQIESANEQLVIATQGIADQISALKAQLEAVKGN